MIIGLRGGHSPNCKGAIGLIDEQEEVRKIYSETVPLLQAAGHTVVNCNSDASTISGELSQGTNTANASNCDIYVTIHMNASTSAAAGGVEVWLYDAADIQMNVIAKRICTKLSEKGLIDRGVKYSMGYHDLNASNMPGMIIETLFCTSMSDVSVYRKLGAKGIAEQLALALDARAGEQRENERGIVYMQCIFSVEGKTAMYFFDGQNVRVLGHPDELKLIQEIYRANTGKDIPAYAWKNSAPWWKRLVPVFQDSRIVTQI